MKTKQPVMATLPDPIPDADSEPNGSFFKIQEPLIELIDKHRRERSLDGKKMTLKEFAEKADLSFANLNGIVNGHRWVARSQRDFIEKLCKALDIPVVQLFAMCGFFKPEDFVTSLSLDKTLNALHSQMVVDQAVSFRAPSRKAWDSWPLDAKLSYTMLYEAFTSKRLQQYAIVNFPTKA